jgi:hypothetical protein
MANLLSTTINGSLLALNNGATNAYSTASNGRLYLGSSAQNDYSIYTHMENFGGNYTKLTLDWHTGIKIGASQTYGGIRFYSDSINNGGSKLFSVGEGDANVRVTNTLYIGGNTAIHSGGGQTIAGITYFSNGESLNLYGIRGAFTNEYIHLYNKVGIGHPGGWGQGEGNTPTQGLSTYGGMNIAYGNGASSTINGYLRINQNWAGGDYGSEAFTIRGTYPSIALRNTDRNNVWLIHSNSDDTISFYHQAGSVDGTGWSRRFFIPTDGNIWMSWAGDYLSNLLGAKQNASTAITTSNIGSQSVSYATSAGSAGQVSGVSVSATEMNRLKVTLGSTGLPYSCDIYVEGDENTYYPVHFIWGDQDVWRRIIIKRGYGEEAPWDPIGTGAHHGGLLLDWEGNFGGWGGAEYSDRLRVFNQSYTDVCADMYIYTHSMGYVFMLRGGHALYHIFSDQEIRGYHQVGTPDIAYDTSTLFYDHSIEAYKVYAPAPVTTTNSSRIDGLRTKKQSLLDGRYANISSWGAGSFFTGQTSQLSVEDGGNFARFAFNNLDFYDWQFGQMLSINDGVSTFSNKISINAGNNYPLDLNGGAHKYLRIQPGNGWEAMVNYHGGTGSPWYVGKRTSSQLVGTESFHFYSEAAGATVGGINPSGDMIVTGSMRAPIFYDSADTNYYVDPNSTSRLVQLNLGSANTPITSTDATGYIRINGSGSNYLAVGSYNDNGWGYIESVNNSNGLYLYTPNGGRFAFDNGDLTPYADAENSLGNTSYRWSQVYTSGWYRNYGSYGLYNNSHGNHFYATNDSQWNIAANGGTPSIAFKSGGYEGTLRGYVYADTGDNIGFLNNAGNWSLRTSSDRKAYIYGNTLSINVGEASWSSIYMHDGDEGVRELHCNSNRIGFLNQAGGWGAWCNDDGDWATSSSMYARAFYDIDDSTYYLDPNSSGTSLKINGGIVSTAGNGAVLLKHEVSEANSWIFRENAANWGLFWLNAGGETGQTIGSYTTVGAELFGMNNAVTGFNPSSAWSGTDSSTRAAWMLSNYNGYLWTQGTQYSEADMRAPIFYDSNDTSYYLDPNSSSRVRNLYVGDSGSNWVDTGGWGTQFHVSNGPHAIFKVFARNEGIETGMFSHVGGQSKAGSFSNHDFAIVRNWDVRMTFYNGYTYANGYLQAADSLRAPIFYDSQDTGYYVDPNSTSRMYQINYDYLYYAPDTNYGFQGTNVYADTINSGYNSDPLELVYYRGTEVRVGGNGGNKDIRAGRFVNGVDTTYYIDLDNTAASMYAAGYIKAKSTYRNNSTAGLPGQDNPVKTASGVLATFSANSASYPYIIIKTRIPQDWHQMGGFTIDLFADYYNSNKKTTISLGGYWNSESNGGFEGFEYNTTNPNVRPDITVMRDITDGMTCFVISGMTWNYPVVVARDLFLGYSSTDIEGGLDWSIFGADDLGGYTNNDAVVCRNAVPADQWYGNTYISYDGRHYGTIFYDSNDTSWYVDPNSTSKLWKAKIGSNTSQDSLAALNVSDGMGSAITYRDIDIKGAWAGGEGHAITATHGGGSADIVGQLVFEHNSPGSRIKWGRLYHNGNSSAYTMQLVSSSTTTADLNLTGNFVASGDVTAYSDARIKTNVQTIENALDKTLQLRGVTYNRTDSEDTSTKVGVIAQEILEVIPEVVKQNDEGMYSVSYGNLTAVLIEAIKEQQKQIDELKEIINGLTK